MTIDITKPLVRRDGIRVEWIHEAVHDDHHFVYGHIDPDGVRRSRRVDCNGRVTKRFCIDDDIMNEPEWEYRPIYVEWIWSSTPTSRSDGFVLGHLRRPSGSTDITEWEIVE